MTIAEEYRLAAHGLKLRADNKTDLRLRLEFELIARKYLLLAEQGEQNNNYDDVIYERPIKLQQRTIR